MPTNEAAQYILNPKQNVVDKIREKLAANEIKYGAQYCPCVLPKFHSQKHICACEEYRTTGHCRCGLYIK